MLSRSAEEQYKYVSAAENIGSAGTRDKYALNCGCTVTNCTVTPDVPSSGYRPVSV